MARDQIPLLAVGEWQRNYKQGDFEEILFSAVQKRVMVSRHYMKFHLSWRSPKMVDEVPLHSLIGRSAR